MSSKRHSQEYSLTAWLLIAVLIAAAGLAQAWASGGDIACGDKWGGGLKAGAIDVWYSAASTECGVITWKVRSLAGGADLSVTAFKNEGQQSGDSVMIDIDSGDDGKIELEVLGGYYYLHIKQRSGGSLGNGYYSVELDCDPQVLRPPTGVTASKGRCDGVVRVGWDEMEGATSYQVDGDNRLLATVTRPYYEDHPANTAQHVYKVRSVYRCGTSGNSDTATGWIKVLPEAPTGVTATKGTECGVVIVTWKSVPGDGVNYVVLRDSTPVTAQGVSPFSDVPHDTLHHSYTVRAANSCGSGPVSDPDDGWVRLVPPPPTGVSASKGTECGQVTITWQTVTEVGIYVVRRDSTEIGTIDRPPFVDLRSDAAQGSYTVQFVDANCGAGSPSDPDKGWPAGAPGAPTELTATKGTKCGQVILTWPEAAGATGYVVQRGPDTVGRTAAPTFSDTPSDGAHYAYTVIATNLCGASNPSPEDTGWAAVAPQGPTALTATKGTICGQVILTWPEAVGGSGYVVRRGPDLVGRTAVPTFTDTSSDGTHYAYTVLATNLCGASNPSPEDTGWAAVAPGAPTGLAATEGTACGEVILAWLPVTGAEGYQVYRGATAVGGTTRSLFHDQPPDTAQYTYTVRATNTLCGAGSASGPDIGWIGLAPEVPTEVTATKGTECKQVTVSWTPVPEATGYVVHRGLTLAGVISASPFHDPIPDQAKYAYTVSATNLCGQSTPSNPATGWAGSAPVVPSQFAATKGTICGEVLLSWAAVAGATGYVIHRDGAVVGTAPQSPFTDTPPDTAACLYTLVATNLCGESKPSEPDPGFIGCGPSLTCQMIGSFPVVTLSGTPGSTYRIEVATRVAASMEWNVWIPAVTVSTDRQAFLDQAGSNQNTRYYRAAFVQ